MSGMIAQPHSLGTNLLTRIEVSLSRCFTQDLDLSSNAFTEWPLLGGRLPPLRQLSLSNNGRLLSAPQDALQGCAGSLQSLDLSGMLPSFIDLYTIKLGEREMYLTMLIVVTECPAQANVVFTGNNPNVHGMWALRAWQSSSCLHRRCPAH